MDRPTISVPGWASRTPPPLFFPSPLCSLGRTYGSWAKGRVTPTEKSTRLTYRIHQAKRAFKDHGPFRYSKGQAEEDTQFTSMKSKWALSVSVVMSSQHKIMPSWNWLVTSLNPISTQHVLWKVSREL